MFKWVVLNIVLIVWFSAAESPVPELLISQDGTAVLECLKVVMK